MYYFALGSIWSYGLCYIALFWAFHPVVISERYDNGLRVIRMSDEKSLPGALLNTLTKGDSYRQATSMPVLRERDSKGCVSMYRKHRHRRNAAPENATNKRKRVSLTLLAHYFPTPNSELPCRVTLAIKDGIRETLVYSDAEDLVKTKLFEFQYVNKTGEVVAETSVFQSNRSLNQSDDLIHVSVLTIVPPANTFSRVQYFEFDVYEEFNEIRVYPTSTIGEQRRFKASKVDEMPNYVSIVNEQGRDFCKYKPYKMNSVTRRISASVERVADISLRSVTVYTLGTFSVAIFVFYDPDYRAHLADVSQDMSAEATVTPIKFATPLLRSGTSIIILAKLNDFSNEDAERGKRKVWKISITLSANNVTYPVIWRDDVSLNSTIAIVYRTSTTLPVKRLPSNVARASLGSVVLNATGYSDSNVSKPLYLLLASYPSKLGKVKDDVVNSNLSASSACMYFENAIACRLEMDTTIKVQNNGTETLNTAAPYVLSKTTDKNISLHFTSKTIREIGDVLDTSRITFEAYNTPSFSHRNHNDDLIFSYSCPISAQFMMSLTDVRNGKTLPFFPANVVRQNGHQEVTVEENGLFRLANADCHECNNYLRVRCLSFV